MSPAVRKFFQCARMSLRTDFFMYGPINGTLDEKVALKNLKKALLDTVCDQFHGNLAFTWRLSFHANFYDFLHIL